MSPRQVSEAADNLQRGRFIVLEGIDGSGTTTQAARLAETLRARGEEVVLTCEPTDGPIGRLIRQALEKRLPGEGDVPRSLDWTAMALLFAADRMDHDATLIRPALGRGQTVVSDRYDLSSLAYQSATSGDGSDPVPWIRQLNARAARPDVTIVLDVNPAVAVTRRKSRGSADELYEADELQKRLAAIYFRAEELVPGDRVVHVDANGDLGEVYAAILAAAESATAAQA